MTSGFVPLAHGPVLRTGTGPHEDLRLARCALLAVVLLEMAVVVAPQALRIGAFQAAPLFKQVSGYSMIALLLFAMGFGWLRRLPSMGQRQKALNAVHQGTGLAMLVLIALHVGARPSGFLLFMFHALALGLGAGALRAVLGARARKQWSTLLLATHIGMTCLVSAAVLLHLYFVYAYTG